MSSICRKFAKSLRGIFVARFAIDSSIFQALYPAIAPESLTDEFPKLGDRLSESQAIARNYLFKRLGGRMTQVVVGENEKIESALRRFKRQVSREGIFADMKRVRHFETPIEKRKRKAIARRRKRRFRSFKSSR